MPELRALRRALLDLHRELLQAQRIQVERFGGRMSSAELLQAASDDFRFGWLRTISELIAGIDEALGDPEADTAALVAEARRLFAPPDPDTAFGRRYLRALQEEPAVVMAHRDVVGALGPPLPES